VQEGYCHLRVFGLQNIDGRQGEDGAGNHSPGTSADALDDHVLTECLAAMRGGRYADGDDGNGDGSLKDLSYLQS